jgi:hypothetical protein
MKDGRCTCLDYYLDIHLTLIVFGCIAVRPSKELAVPDAEGSIRRSRPQLRSLNVELPEPALQEMEDRRLIYHHC